MQNDDLSQYLIPATGLKQEPGTICMSLTTATFSILNPGNGTETNQIGEIAIIGAFSILNPGDGTETASMTVWTVLFPLLSQYLIPATGLKLCAGALLDVLVFSFSILNPGDGTETISYYNIYVYIDTFSILNPGDGTETLKD